MTETHQTDAQRLSEIAAQFARWTEGNSVCNETLRQKMIEWNEYLRSLADRLSRPCAEVEDAAFKAALEAHRNTAVQIHTLSKAPDEQRLRNAFRAYTSVLRAKEEGRG